MKDVITCILKEGASEPYELVLAIGKEKVSSEQVQLLLDFKNFNLLNGEEPITLLHIKANTDKTCYSHDWRVKGDHYMCRDCKIPGQRTNAFSPIKPTFEDPMYKDCKWKFKPE